MRGMMLIAPVQVNRIKIERILGKGNSDVMTEAAIHLEQAIQQAACQYFRLVVLAGASGVGKTAALQSIAHKFDYPLVNVNLELSKRLLELSRTQRSRQVERLLKEVINAVPGEVVLLDNLEILFDVSLEVEQLRMLQMSSRNRTIVASWNGSYQDGTLTYAEPGYSEFIQFKQTDVVVITIGTGTND